MDYSRRKFIKHSGLLTALAYLPIQLSCANSSKRPNVVLFFSDEMDPTYLGYGGGNYPTPNFDVLASQGVRFTNAFACAAMCTPSRYGLLTGQYPGRCSHPKFREDYPTDQAYSVGWNSYIDESIQTLPGILSEHGYITGMVGKWHIGPSGLQADEYFAQLDENAKTITPEMNENLKKHQQRLQRLIEKEAGFDHARSVIWTNNDDFKVKQLSNHNFPWVTKGAVDLLEEFKSQDKPFFLYVASTAVHGPHHGESLDYDMRNTQEGRIDDVLQYSPDVAKIKSAIKGMSKFESYKYAGMAELDNQVGILMNKLKELDLEDNTIFIFMSDHNVEPGKASCYQQGLHIPAIIRWPAQIEAGISSSSLIQNVDIMPTILEVAGVEKPTDTKIDGTSLLPLINGTKNKVRDYIFADSGYARSVSNGKYKYIAFRPPQDVVDGMADGTVKYAPNFLNVFKQAHSQISIEYYPNYFDQDQLYDLEADPYEQNNLAYNDEYASVLKDMQEVLSNHLATFENSYNLERIPFMETGAYRRLTARTKKIGTNFISWWRGRKINFPPQ